MRYVPSYLVTCMATRGQFLSFFLISSNPKCTQSGVRTRLGVHTRSSVPTRSGVRSGAVGCLALLASGLWLRYATLQNWIPFLSLDCDRVEGVGLVRLYGDRLKSVQILLSRVQAGSGRTGKQEQEETSRNHVPSF